MVKVGVIADDLTGANATGALLSKRGIRSVSVLDPRALDSVSSLEGRVIIVSTSSRYLSPEEAYERVQSAFRSLIGLGCGFLSKRIDTTLRGNIGYEVDAMMDASDDFPYALVLPSFPSAGRICLGGHVLVNSIPLDETEVIRESVFRFDTSSAVKILAKQSKRKVLHIPYDVVRQGEGAVIDSLNGVPENSLVVLDAVTDADIERLSTYCLKWGKRFIPVDPGPFTASLASHMFRGETVLPKILVVIGSVTELIRKQVEYLSKSYEVRWIKLDVRRLISGDPKDEIEEKVNLIKEGFRSHFLVGLITALSDEDVISFEEAERLGLGKDLYNRINDVIGLIVSRVLEENKDLIKGLYVSGGDTVSAIGKSLGALGISVKDEVYPLAAFGRLVGGAFDGLAVVTKGGLVGKEDTIKLCVDYLLRSLYF